MWTPEEQGYREAYLNAKLARKWLDPAAHPWAALDFAGVEFGSGACQQALSHYRQVWSQGPRVGILSLRLCERVYRWWWGRKGHGL